MTLTAVSRRHPPALLRPGRYSTAVMDFEPPAEVIGEALSGLQWGMRTAFGNPQYLVYDAECVDVLASGQTPEHAAISALARIQRESLPPAHFHPRLQGCTFGRRTGRDSNFVFHTVINSEGEEIAYSDDGRDAACRLAAKALAQAVDGPELSFDEFLEICLVIPIQRTHTWVKTKRAPWAVFDGDYERSRLRVQMRQIWESDELCRTDGQEVGRIKGNSDMKEFLSAAEVSLLQLTADMGGDISTVRLGFCDGARQVFLNFASSSRMSAASIQRMAYEAYLGDRAERVAPRVSERGG